MAPWRSQGAVGASGGPFSNLCNEADFVHKIDELVVLAEGKIEIEIEGRSHFPKIGEEQFIPAKALHTVRNTGSNYNVWYYGYTTI